MENFISQLEATIFAIRNEIPLALACISVLWLSLILNKALDYRLNLLGIYPRHLSGLPGIFFHPFLHGSFNHLFFNSIPLFVLLTFTLTLGWVNFVCITLFIVLINGLLTWLLGRKGLHVGASGLVMGYWSFLLVYSYRNPSVLTFVLALICLYYFGSLIFNIFPTEEGVSWEGHLFGLIAGVITTACC